MLERDYNGAGELRPPPISLREAVADPRAVGLEVPPANPGVQQAGPQTGAKAAAGVQRIFAVLLLCLAIAGVQGFRIHDALNFEARSDAKRDIDITQQAIDGDLGVIVQPRALSHLTPAAVGLVGGMDAQTARTLTSVLCLVLVATMIGWVVWRETSSGWASLYAGAFILLNDKYAKPNNYLLGDLLPSLLLFAGILLLFYKERGKTRRMGFAAGALIGLSIWAKEAGIVMAPAALAIWFCWSIWRCRGRFGPPVRNLAFVLAGIFVVLGPIVANSIADGRGATGSLILQAHEEWLPRAYVHLLTGKHLWRVSDRDVAAYEAEHGSLPQTPVMFNYWRWPLKTLENKLSLAGTYFVIAARITYLPLFLALAFIAGRRRVRATPTVLALACAAVAMAAAIAFAVVFYEPRYFFLCHVLLIPVLWTVLRKSIPPTQRAGAFPPAFHLASMVILSAAFLDFAKNRLLGVNLESLLR